ncbi:MAG: SVM family protein [Candidatus Phytoplasma pruni]|uniref:SVM family protein n=1 Tax=Milkweed yellows phytoplasma TaxID=208434 RepID=UPI0003603076|nr:SVM family protein [Milkweed yellows phytoplasma]
MFKVKNQFKIVIIILFSYLGLFIIIINNNPLMAMNNNIPPNQNNENINNIEEFQNLMLLQRNSTNQIVNALFNNASEQEITNLLNQHRQTHQQIVNYQQRLLDVQQQMIRNIDLYTTRLRLERESLQLANSMMAAINNTPLYASESQINVLRNIQINIDQVNTQIDQINQQIRNQ